MQLWFERFNCIRKCRMLLYFIKNKQISFMVSVWFLQFMFWKKILISQIQHWIKNLRISNVIKYTPFSKLLAVPIPPRAITTFAVGEGQGKKRGLMSKHDSNDSKRIKTVHAVSHDFVVPSEEGKYRKLLSNGTLHHLPILNIWTQLKKTCDKNML